MYGARTVGETLQCGALNALRRVCPAPLPYAESALRSKHHKYDKLLVGECVDADGLEDTSGHQVLFRKVQDYVGRAVQESERVHSKWKKNQKYTSPHYQSSALEVNLRMSAVVLVFPTKSKFTKVEGAVWSVISMNSKL